MATANRTSLWEPKTAFSTTSTATSSRDLADIVAAYVVAPHHPSISRVFPSRESRPGIRSRLLGRHPPPHCRAGAHLPLPRQTAREDARRGRTPQSGRPPQLHLP